jgi:hypothetical protein
MDALEVGSELVGCDKSCGQSFGTPKWPVPDFHAHTVPVATDTAGRLSTCCAKSTVFVPDNSTLDN